MCVRVCVCAFQEKKWNPTLASHQTQNEYLNLNALWTPKNTYRVGVD